MSEGGGYSGSVLRSLAEDRFEDARLLFDHQRFSSAYYLAGYAVELALKASIAKTFKADTIPEPGLVRKLYVHDLADLMRLADLTLELNEAMAANGALAVNWSTVAEWDVSSRYAVIEQERCARLMDAVGDPDDGVFTWLKTHW